MVCEFVVCAAWADVSLRGNSFPSSHQHSSNTLVMMSHSTTISAHSSEDECVAPFQPSSLRKCSASRSPSLYRRRANPSQSLRVDSSRTSSVGLVALSQHEGNLPRGALRNISAPPCYKQDTGSCAACPENFYRKISKLIFIYLNFNHHFVFNVFLFADRAIGRRSRREDDIATHTACEIYAKRQIRRITQREAYEVAISMQVQARLYALSTTAQLAAHAHGLITVPAPAAVAHEPGAILDTCTSAVKHEMHGAIDLTRD